MKKFEIKSPEAKGEEGMKNVTEVSKYDTTVASIQKMKTELMVLKIDGIKDVEGYNKVHNSRMKVRDIRIDVERRQTDLNSGLHKLWKKNKKLVDDGANELLEEIKPIENHLKAEEKKVDEIKEKVREEKRKAQEVRIQGRVDALFAVGFCNPISVLMDMSDEDFEVLLADSTKAYHQAQADKAERERVAKEEEEAERKAKEDEKKHFAKVKAEQEAKEKKLKADEEHIKKEQEVEKARIAKDQADKEKALQVEKDRIAKDQADREAKIKVAQDKLDAEKREKERQEELRQAKLKAAAQAVKDAEENKRLEAEEKKRQENLKPDKEKLLSFANVIADIEGPILRSKKPQALLAATIQALSDVSDNLVRQVDKL